MVEVCACNKMLSPVVCTDGNKYNNECLANCAGQTNCLKVEITPPVVKPEPKPLAKPEPELIVAEPEPVPVAKPVTVAKPEPLPLSKPEIKPLTILPPEPEEEELSTDDFGIKVY